MKTILITSKSFFMKKVRCKHGGKWYYIECDIRAKGPSKGDILTVTKEFWEEGKKYYQFLEWPVEDDESGYNAKWFEDIEDVYEQVTYSQIKERASLN